MIELIPLILSSTLGIGNFRVVFREVVVVFLFKTVEVIILRRLVVCLDIGVVRVVDLSVVVGDLVVGVVVEEVVNLLIGLSVGNDLSVDESSGVIGD